MTTPIKVAMLGDTGVGKTSLMLRFANGTFTDTASQTTQVDKISSSITINGQTHALEIWDTAGQEQFGGVTPSYYRKARGGIVVYDTTNEESFEDVEQWIEDVTNYSAQGVRIMLVGNKCDLKERQVVDTSSAQGMAKGKGISFIETSAKDDVNVKNLFETLVREILNDPKDQAELQANGIKLEAKNQTNNQSRPTRCC